MADLALAIPTTVPAAPTTIPTGGKAAAAAPTDPFAILMAAATPAASAAPAATLPVATNADETILPDVAEKSGDSEGDKNDADASSDPDALLALLTAPTPAAQPIVNAAPIPEIAVPTTVTQDPTPTPGPAEAYAALTTPRSTPMPQRTPTPVEQAAASAPVQATQTSIHALVQMMAAQADAAPVQQEQQAAVQAFAQSPDTAAVAIPADAEQAAPATIALAAAQPAPAAAARHTIAPKLDRSGAPVAKADAKAAKPEQTRPQERDPRRVAERPAAEGAPQVQPQQAAAAPMARDVAASVQVTSLGSADAVVTRHLAVARDGLWLDSLAKDIAATGGSNSNLSFTLSPENLGMLKVDILAGDDGASVHMTTDNDTARNIILDAQPRLAAEARAQGLTIKESSVSTNSDPQRQAQGQTQGQAFAQSNGQPGGQDRRGFAQSLQQPVPSTFSTPADEESDGALYA